MTNPISICNNSLSDIGLQPILSLNDGSTRANLCRDKYPSARDAVLELHPWNFATFYATLAANPTTETSSYAYTYQHTLPTDPYCLRVLEAQSDVGFEIGQHKDYGRVLWTNSENVRIKYIGRVEDTGMWNELAVKALEKMLAAELSTLSSAPGKNKQTLLQEMAGLIPAAQGRDAREGRPIVLTPNNRLLHARHRACWR